MSNLPRHPTCPPNGCGICLDDWPCARLVAERTAKTRGSEMNNLPTLPAATLLRRVMPDDYRYGDIYGHTDAALRAYGEACAAAAAAAEREAIINLMPGGHSVDPQWVCDVIRARGET